MASCLPDAAVVAAFSRGSLLSPSIHYQLGDALSARVASAEVGSHGTVTRIFFKDATTAVSTVHGPTTFTMVALAASRRQSRRRSRHHRRRAPSQRRKAPHHRSARQPAPSLHRCLAPTLMAPSTLMARRHQLLRRRRGRAVVCCTRPTATRLAERRARPHTTEASKRAVSGGLQHRRALQLATARASMLPSTCRAQYHCC